MGSHHQVFGDSFRLPIPNPFYRIKSLLPEVGSRKPGPSRKMGSVMA